MHFLSVCLVLVTFFFFNFISPTHLWRVWVLGTWFGCINTLGWPIIQPSVCGSATVSSCDPMPMLARQQAEPSAMPHVSGYRASKRSRCSSRSTWQQPLACKESWFGSSQLTCDSLTWTLCSASVMSTEECFYSSVAPLASVALLQISPELKEEKQSL